MNISPVPIAGLPVVLDQVVPLIKRATDRSGGRWTASDAIDEILDEKQVLWIAYEGSPPDLRIWGVVTTRVAEYPRLKFLDIVICAGEDMKRWISPMLSELDKWRAEQGCAGMECVGRPGWERRLEPFGWKPRYIIMEKIAG